MQRRTTVYFEDGNGNGGGGVAPTDEGTSWLGAHLADGVSQFPGMFTVQSQSVERKTDGTVTANKTNVAGSFLGMPSLMQGFAPQGFWPGPTMQQLPSAATPVAQSRWSAIMGSAAPVASQAATVAPPQAATPQKRARVEEAEAGTADLHLKNEVAALKLIVGDNRSKFNRFQSELATKDRQIESLMAENAKLKSLPNVHGLREELDAIIASQDSNELKTQRLDTVMQKAQTVGGEVYQAIFDAAKSIYEDADAAKKSYA
jgi:hypothetical protein